MTTLTESAIGWPERRARVPLGAVAHREAMAPSRGRNAGDIGGDEGWSRQEGWINEPRSQGVCPGRGNATAPGACRPRIGDPEEPEGGSLCGAALQGLQYVLGVRIACVLETPGCPHPRIDEE